MSPSCLGGISVAGARSCLGAVDAPAFQFPIADGGGERRAPAARLFCSGEVAHVFGQLRSQDFGKSPGTSGFQAVHFTKG